MKTFSAPSFLAADRLGSWTIFLEQIRRVTPHLGPLAELAHTLIHPKRILIVDVPIRLDDGTMAHFEGYRVQHDTARGPGKGGVRFHPDVTLPEIMTLAAWMSIKNAAVNLPFGGAKGGVRVDPRTLSGAELERITRRYTSEIGFMIGPDKDIPAPDVNTDEQIMAWMMDTYSMNAGHPALGVVTGKPVSLGGSLGRKDATGRGVFVTAAEAAKVLNIALAGSRCAIQGFGNVGYAAARLFHEHGCEVVAVQNSSGAIFDARGVDPQRLHDRIRASGSLAGFPGAETVTTDEFWRCDVEFLVPAAIEEQITPANAAGIRAKIVVEGANGLVTPEADDILDGNGVLVVPDVLANAGGVTVSYFEWVQDISNLFWSENEINARLDKLMTDAYHAVAEVAAQRKTNLRTAAYIVGCERILKARLLRGLYP